MKCGLCNQTVLNWESHIEQISHKEKEKAFFENEEAGIGRIFNEQHLHSRINAQIIFLILKQDYEERLKCRNLAK